VGAKWFALAVLVATLAVAARVATIDGKAVLTHDETVSYLAATCHQGEYGRMLARGAAPVGTWVPARTWQRFLEPEPRWCLGTIRADLAHWDIHPPAYFWLLHAWTRAFGTGLGTGAALGFLIDVLTALALFGLAREVTRRASAAIAVSAVWALSPAVVPIAAEARQYPLLALAAVLLAWAVTRLLGRGASARRCLALAAVTCLGLLTHFQFPVVAAGAGLLLLGPMLRRPRGSATAGVAAMAAGALLALLVQPGFAESLRRQQEQAAGANDVLARLGHTVRTLANFLLPGSVMPTALAVVIVAAGAVLLLLVVRDRRRERDESALRVVFLFGWIAAVTCASYLAGRSHGQAMAGKYLAAAWPFAAFVPVLALHLIARRARPFAAVAGAASLAALGLLAGVAWYPDRAPPPSMTLARGDGAVVDVTRRGELPRLAFLLPAGMPVFAADQRSLASPGFWRRLPERRLVYLSNTFGTNTPAEQDRVLDAAAHRRWRVRSARRGLWQAADAFVLTRARARRRG